MADIKRIDIKEFREKGFLQEANRLFFHPLGLALEVQVDENTGKETLGGIWDYREDPEGMIYDIANLPADEKETMAAKAKYVTAEFKKHDTGRLALFGNRFEPIK